MPASRFAAASSPNKVSHPLIGFGTYTLGGATCEDALNAALHAGYRLIDTASGYKNEQIVGNVLRRCLSIEQEADDMAAPSSSQLGRRNIWVTTKISPNALKCPEPALKAEIKHLMTRVSSGGDEKYSMQKRGRSDSGTRSPTGHQGGNDGKKNPRSVHGCTSPYSPANCPPVIREQAFINLVTRAVRESCYQSLVSMGLQYIDVLMLHWPAIGGRPVQDPLNVVLRNHVLFEMMKLAEPSAQLLPPSGFVGDEQFTGKQLSMEDALPEVFTAPVRYIAVSNFQVRHLESFRSFVLSNEFGGEKSAAILRHQHPIHIHQFELHPLCRQREVVRYCLRHGISIQQYSPLGSAGPGVALLLALPSIRRAAEELSRINAFRSLLQSNGPLQYSTYEKGEGQDDEGLLITPAHVCLLWGFWFVAKESEYARRQHRGVIPPGALPVHSTLPRSQTPARIHQNYQAFLLWDLVQRSRGPLEPPAAAGGMLETELSAFGAVMNALEEGLLRYRMEHRKEADDLSLGSEELEGEEYDIHFCWESSKVL